jgi:hypothetical protein
MERDAGTTDRAGNRFVAQRTYDQALSELDKFSNLSLEHELWVSQRLEEYCTENAVLSICRRL